jgi:hypothetical protein
MLIIPVKALRNLGTELVVLSPLREDGSSGGHRKADVA